VRTGTTTFKLEASFDRKGRAAVVYLRIREGKLAETREIVDGSVNADYDSDGVLLGGELYGRCRLEDLAAFSAGEPEEVRRFLTGAVPCGMLLPSARAGAVDVAGQPQSQRV